MEIEKKEYGTYVKEITPVHSTVKNMLRAFLAGGAVCTIGQACLGLYGTMGMEKETAAAWTTLTLIAASVLLTGLGLYQRIVKFAGAGALVPITGFANSVAAAAIEYRAEGHVFGIGCKIFTIAGPVILYGIFASWALGLVYLDGRGPGAPSALIRVRKLEKRILQRRLRRCFYGIFFCFGERPADGKGKGSHRIRQKFRDNR